MPFVIYATPNYTENAVRFIETFLNVPGVTLGLIAGEPVEWLRQDLRNRLTAFCRIEDVFDAEQLCAATQTFANQHGSIHRIIGAVEQVQVPMAQVRESFGIVGMGVEAAKNFRDKDRMKRLFEQAGIPCARHQTVRSLAEAEAFIAKVGFPIIAKPPAGAGSQATYKIENQSVLEKVFAELTQQQTEILLEEFVTGTEHSFDTFSLQGKPVFHSLTHYYPNPIEVVREPWIQWQVVLPREVEAPQYDDIRQYAFQTLDTLGMSTGISHLEWFRRTDGSIAISEVAARPPGAQFPTLISRANDFNALEAWAHLMVYDTFTPPQRKYAVGAAYLRGMGKGRVFKVHGLEEINREVGHLVTDAKIPKPGQEASSSYEGEGYIILRHTDTEVVKRALNRVVSLARVELREI
ncbi:MAG: ATP-grasp domain-containing protein [Saprospiraceae bacterium]